MHATESPLAPTAPSERLTSAEIAALQNSPYGTTTVKTGTNKWLNSPGKRAFDLVGASVLALATAPVWVPTIIALSFGKGGAFFVQPRIGKNGEVFNIYKLRTMRHAQADVSGKQVAQKDDLRTTKFTAFLRKYHVDELAQLINVFLDEMSLIGFRPLPLGVTESVEHYEGYEERFANDAIPGITGLGQTDEDATYDRGEEINAVHALRWDAYYAENASFALDLEILARTVKRVIFPKKNNH